MGARSLGTLTLDLVAQTGGFVDGLDKAERKTRKTAQSVEESAAVIGKATAAAALVAATGIAALVKSQIDLADAASDSAQKAGVSVEEWSKLSYAFKFGTKDGADLGQTLLFLNKAISGASQGVKGNVEDFSALGVAYKNSDGSIRGASEVLDDIADKFAKLPDSAQKAALATQFFGKSGADIIPFLNQGAAGIKAFKDEAQKMGLVLSQDTADAAGKFNDNLERLKGNIAGAANQIGAAIIPALADMSDGLVGAGGLVDKFKGSIDEIVTVAEVLGTVLAGRLAASVAKSAVSFAAGQLEAMRYEAALARMAGAGGVASAAMGGIAGAGRSLLGLLGGPVGLAVTVATLGLSFIDFSKDADVATLSAQDFDKQLASLTGNTEKLRESQKQLKLDNLMSSMRAISDEITRINTESERSNQKLGLGEQQRIAELQRRLAELGKAYQEVANQKVAAASAPTGAADILGPVSKPKAKAAEDNFDYNAGNYLGALKEFNDYNNEKALADEAWIAAENQRLTDKFKTESEIVAEKRAKDLKDWEDYSQLMQFSHQQHEAGVYRIEQEAADARAAIAIRERDKKLSVAKDIFGNLSTLTSSHNKKLFEAGKVAAIGNAIVSTYQGAANALATVPYPFNFAAAASVVAAGMVNIANIRAQTFGGGGGVSPAVGNPQLSNSGGGNGGGGMDSSRNIYLHGIEPSKQYSGQQMLDLINMAIADGGTLRVAQ